MAEIITENPDLTIVPGLVMIYPAKLLDLGKKPFIIFGKNRVQNIHHAVNILPYLFEHEMDYDSNRLKKDLSSETIVPASIPDIKYLNEVIESVLSHYYFLTIYFLGYSSF